MSNTIGIMPNTIDQKGSKTCNQAPNIFINKPKPRCLHWSLYTIILRQPQLLSHMVLGLHIVLAILCKRPSQDILHHPPTQGNLENNISIIQVEQSTDSICIPLVVLPVNQIRNFPLPNFLLRLEKNSLCWLIR